MTEIDSMKILKERSVKRNKVIYLCLVILFIQGCRGYDIPELKLGMGREVVLNSEIKYTYDTASTQRYYFAMDSILLCNTNLSGLGRNISGRLFTSDDINKIRSEIKIDSHYIEIIHPGDLHYDYGFRFVDKENKYCLYLVILFKHLELFPPNYNFTPVFEFTPVGFGYYVIIIPITYIAANNFFLHVDKDMPWNIAFEIRKALSGK